MAVDSVSDLHDHELIFEDEDKLDTDYVKMKICDICGFLMFINSSYSCREEGCKFSIHKECAQLPRKKEFVFDSTTYRLSLTKKDAISKNCTKCFRICNNFTYSTLGRYRNYHFHPLCVERKEIKTKHRSHFEHPMTPTHKEISALCNACGVDDKKDHFLSCQSCNYWIHKDCALLPPLGMHPSHANHPLILLYSNPFSRQNSSWGDCEICKKDMPIHNGVYTCQACSYFVHLNCFKSQIKPLTLQESSKHIIVLPPAEEEHDIFPSFVIRNEQQEIINDNQIGNGTIIKRLTLEECHEHELTSHDNCNNDNKEDDRKILTMGVCNACVQPISSSCKYYSCSKTGCHFLVHQLCARLSSTTIESKFPGAQINLFTKYNQEFFHAFFCYICARRCNGFEYRIVNSQVEWWRSSNIIADVECASAPRIIKHQSHNHVLHLIKSSSLHYTQKQFSCCRYTYWCPELLYMCMSCDFNIHVSCALLPKKVSHDFDDHPLQLITDNNILAKRSEENVNYFCEFCEGDIDLHFWLYYCAECDQSFHVDCIPSVGDFSKLKFGGTIDGSSHPHPLTSVRMLNVGSQTCGLCKHKIDGFKDGVAFQCLTCDFWTHWNC